MQVLPLGTSATSLLLVASVSKSVPSAVYQIGQVLNASHARFQVSDARAGTWQDARRTSVLQAGGDEIVVRLVRTIPLSSSACGQSALQEACLPRPCISQQLAQGTQFTCFACTKVQILTYCERAQLYRCKPHKGDRDGTVGVRGESSLLRRAA